MFFQRLLILAAGVTCCGLLAGCGNGTYPVQGKIVYDTTNQPATNLQGYTVMAESTEREMSSVGEVDAQGNFSLSTFKPGDGVPAGKYRVAITPPVQLSDSSLGPSKIENKYMDPTQSGLELTVPVQGEVVLTVTPKSAKPGP